MVRPPASQFFTGKPVTSRKLHYLVLCMCVYGKDKWLQFIEFLTFHKSFCEFYDKPHLCEMREQSYLCLRCIHCSASAAAAGRLNTLIQRRRCSSSRAVNKATQRGHQGSKFFPTFCSASSTSWQLPSWSQNSCTQQFQVEKSVSPFYKSENT